MKKEHFEILLEDIDSKFDLVLEGLQGLRNDMGRMEERLSAKIDLNTGKLDILNEKVDRNTARIEALDEKLSNRIDTVEENLGSHIDAVAADLKAHRADTEIHHGVYRVKEKAEG